ncbi:MAG: hypothetical protein RIT32_433 [Actinomycetota bacterium]|jgi:hypothetical protein
MPVGELVTVLVRLHHEREVTNEEEQSLAQIS